jgi:hypothetical protein
LVAVPPLHPSWVKIVAVASVAVMTRNVSQPIEVSQDTTPGTFCPVTPNAARDRTMVGAEPRLPAMAMTPQRANDTTTPTTVTRRAWVKEMPKPRTKPA